MARLKLNRMLSRIDERLTLLSERPFLGKARPEIAQEARSFAVPPYVILYRSIDHGIEVVRVFHGAREYLDLYTDE